MIIILMLRGRVFVLSKTRYTITSKNDSCITYIINLFFVLKIVNFFYTNMFITLFTYFIKFF